MSSPPRKKEKKEEAVMRLPIDAPIDFNVHSHLTNLVFIVEGRKIYAGKDFLSLHSPVFNRMFYGDFAEKDQKEIELKDVPYKDFREMLKLLYNADREIKDRDIESLLVLADRYDIKAIVDRAENQLIDSKNHTKEEKLDLADQFRLIKLEAKCKAEGEGTRREKWEMDDRPMKSCEISKNEMESMKFVTSGVFNSIFDEEEVLQYEMPCDAVRRTLFEIAGLWWEVKIYHKLTNNLSFILIVDDDQHTEINWSAEGIVEIEVISPHSKEENFLEQFEFSFDNVVRKGSTGYVYEVEKELYHGGAWTVEVCARIYLKKLTGVRVIPQFDITAPSSLSDATLVVGDKRLYVNKQYLSSMSNVFREMFNEDQSGMKSEFELEDVEYQKFIEFLRWCYPSFTKNFDGDTLDQFVKMADDFDISFISDDIESYLNTTAPCALIPQKICLHFASDIEIEIDEHMDHARTSWDTIAVENGVMRPEWLLPLLKKSRIYKSQPRQVKIEILEYIIKLSNEGKIYPY